MRRAVLLAAATAIVAVLAAGMASADPVNSKNAQIFTLDCGGEEVTLVATLFNNRAVVVNVVDTTGNFVFTRIEGTATFTDPETGLVVVEPFDLPIGQGQKKGLQGSLTTCETTLTFEEPEGTFTVDLTVTGFFTPRRG